MPARVSCARRENKHNIKLIEAEIFSDLIIYLILGIIIGGRLGYVIFYNFDLYPFGAPVYILPFLRQELI